jgi:hypothetical protein
LREKEFKLVNHRDFKQKADQISVERRGQEERDGVIIVKFKDYCKI